jgi:GT2 family glycosyltransferase
MQYPSPASVNAALLKQPIVSIIMPMRNAGAFVDRALASILQECEIPLEVVVVDDGSTDGSANRVGAIADPRIRLISGPQQGIAAALNAGLAQAKGDIFMRCDADDLYASGRIQQQAMWLMNHPDFVAICSSYTAIAPAGWEVISFPCGSKAEEITKELQQGVTRTHLCTYAIRMPAIQALGGFRPYFGTAEDIDFQLRLAEFGRVWYTPTTSYYYRLHNTSITHTQSLSEQEFFKSAAQEFQRQRLTRGSDDLQRGCPPVLTAPLPGPIFSSEEHIHGLLLGSAWSKHAEGQKFQALKIGLRTTMTYPTYLESWRSLLLLLLKPVPKPSYSPVKDLVAEPCGAKRSS